jgi:hypothetical protein
MNTYRDEDEDWDAEDHSSPQKPLWVVATAVVCLAIAIWLAFAAF